MPSRAPKPSPREATRQVAFRLPDMLLLRLDAYAERMRGAQPGIDVTRTDVVRVLLTRALQRVEDDLPKKKA